MASPLPSGHFEVECSDLSIKVGFHPRRSIDSPRPSCGSPPDAKRQDRDPSDPRSTSVVSDVYPLQTRMRQKTYRILATDLAEWKLAEAALREVVRLQPVDRASPMLTQCTGRAEHSNQNRCSC